jgi:hypothetical protein
MSESEAYDWSTHDWSKGPRLRAKFLSFELWQWNSTKLSVCDTKDRQDGDPMDVDGAQGKGIPSFSPPQWIDVIKVDGVDVEQLYTREYIRFGGRFCLFIFSFQGGEMMWLMKSAFNTAAGTGSADKFIDKVDKLKAQEVGNKDGQTYDSAVDLRSPSPPPRLAKSIKPNPEPATRQKRGSTPENDRGTVYESIESPPKLVVRQTREPTPNDGRYGNTPSAPPLQRVEEQTQPAITKGLEIQKVIYNRLSTSGSKSVIHAIVRRFNGTYDIVQQNKLYDEVIVRDSSNSLAPIADKAFISVLMGKHKIKLDMSGFKCVGCVGYYPGRRGKAKPWRLVMLEVNDPQHQNLLQIERKGYGNYNDFLLIPLSMFYNSFKTTKKIREDVEILYKDTEFFKSEGESVLRHETLSPKADDIRAQEDARRRMAENMEDAIKTTGDKIEERMEKNMNKMNDMMEKLTTMVEMMMARTMSVR